MNDSNDILNEVTDPKLGTLPVWVDGDTTFVHSLHKPIWQFLFQSSMKINLYKDE